MLDRIKPALCDLDATHPALLDVKVSHHMVKARNLQEFVEEVPQYSILGEKKIRMFYDALAPSEVYDQLVAEHCQR